MRDTTQTSPRHITRRASRQPPEGPGRELHGSEPVFHQRHDGDETEVSVPRICGGVVPAWIQFDRFSISEVKTSEGGNWKRHEELILGRNSKKKKKKKDRYFGNASKIIMSSARLELATFGSPESESLES